MTGGTRTYSIPENVKVDVDFEIDEGAPTFLGASIDGQMLDVDGILVNRRVQQQYNKFTTYSIKAITLREYFQGLLNDDAKEIVAEDEDAGHEARRDFLDGR